MHLAANDPNLSGLAQVAAGALAMYEEVCEKLSAAKATRHATVTSISERLDQVLEWNRLYFEAMQHALASKADGEAHEYGAQLSRLQHAHQLLLVAIASMRTSEMPIAPLLSEAYQQRSDLLQAEIAPLLKDNETVYVHTARVHPPLPRTPMVHAVTIKFM